jgi:hypothetical protein
LFDASCFYDTQEFLTIEIDIFDLWDECPGDDPKDSGVARSLEQNWSLEPLGDHYFVKQNTTLVPVFDFTSTRQNKGNPNAIFFGKKIEDILSPDGTDNVDWLELQNVGGPLATLANTVYRVKTVEGQPPATVSASLLVPVTFN